MTDIEIKIGSKNSLETNNSNIEKMGFLFNALNNGWTIQKKKDSYIFTKKHEGKKEVYKEEYLTDFVKHNADINTFLS